MGTSLPVRSPKLGPRESLSNGAGHLKVQGQDLQFLTSLESLSGLLQAQVTASCDFQECHFEASGWSATQQCGLAVGTKGYIQSQNRSQSCHA